MAERWLSVWLVIIRRTSLLLLALLATSCLGGSDSPSLGSARITAIANPPGLFYDVSPNGQWVSYVTDSGSVCLMPTELSEQSTEHCVEAPNGAVFTGLAGRVSWAPDSSKVVISGAWYPRGVAAPLTVLETDGSFTSLLAPVDSEDRRRHAGGDAYEAVFLDSSTLLYSTNYVDEGRGEWRSIKVSGADDQLMADFAIGADLDDFPEPEWILHDGMVLSATGTPGSSAANGSLVAIDLGGATAPEILVSRGSTDGTFNGERFSQAAGSYAVVVDSRRLGDFARNKKYGPLLSLFDFETRELLAIADRPDYTNRSAAISPDGRHLVVIGVYNGEDREIQRSTAALQLSITSVSKLVEGDPEWTDLTDFAADPNTSAGLDLTFGTVTWDSSGQKLYLGLLDQVYEVDFG